MKKIIALFVIVTLCSTANIQVFSQKLKQITNKKLPITKNETPGNVPSDVKLKSATAVSDGNGVYIEWQTEYENKNLGFYLYRVSAAGTELVSDGVIAGGRSTSSEDVVYGGKYSYFDAKGDSAASYYIESLQLNGNRKMLGEVSTKRVASLNAFAGTSSKELKKKNDQLAKAAEGRSEAVLPDELKAQYEANLVPPDLAKQRWLAAQPGVKIGVKQEGIYRVSRTELQNAGFNVSAPGNLWQLYTDGKQQSIIVGQNDSYIEFYGVGLDTAETDARTYYLIAGTENGLRMNSTPIRQLSGNIVGANYYQTFVRKDRKLYLSPDILNGDEENFFGNVAILGSSSTPPVATITFNLSGIDFNSPNAVFEFTVQGIAGAPHEVLGTINNNPLGTITGNGFTRISGSFQIPVSSLIEGTNTLRMQSFGGQGANLIFDSIRVGYSRKFEAVQNKLSFYTNNYRQTTISGFTSQNIRVFDLTLPDNPSVLTNLSVANNAGNWSITMPSNRGRVVFATEDSAILSPASIVANNPSSLATAAHNGELLIISYKDWMTQAEDWANYRRAQGMVVEVVNVEDIFDEFSYGSVSPSALTDFFIYAKNNWQTAPNYVLLIGDYSYDPRNYENRLVFQNFVPTKRVDTLYEETGSDEALCDFNNDGLAEIAVGRIPARNAAQVTQMLNKTMAFEANLATAYGRGMLLASDLPEGYNFEALNQRLSEQMPASLPKSFLNRGQADSKNALISSFNQGRYMVNYSGHGASGSWNGEWINLTDASNLTNSPNYTVFNMLTCMNGYFLRTDFDSLAEALLRAQNGGAAAVWASTGKTTPDVQEVLAARFYNQLNVGTMNRFGDLVKDAKQNVIGGRDVRLSWALLGDPTMKLKP